MGTLRNTFPTGRFNEPAKENEIAAAEKELGAALPRALRDLYLEADGFREPRHSAEYLRPIAMMVGDTKFMWSALGGTCRDIALPDFAPFIFFGHDLFGGCWGIRHEPPNDVIYWRPDMLDEGPIYDRHGDSIIEAMKIALLYYDELEDHDIG